MTDRRSLRFTSRLTSLLFSASAFAALFAAPACGGGSEDTGDGDGDGGLASGGTGDGDLGTGGTNGDGDGDVGTGGMNGDGDVATGGAGAGGGDGDGDGDIATGGAGTGGDAGTGGTNGDGDGLTTNYNCGPAEGTIPLLALETVASGFSDPVYVTHAGDERLFVVERRGVIQVVENGQALPEPFLDISDDVESGQSEQGLLGLAFHPNYAENGLFYIYYIKDTGGNGTSTVEEYSVNASNPNVADPATAREILTVPQPNWNHNGGTVTFGPDGMLYLALGDGGGGGDPDGNGQNLNTLLGKLLRIDVDGREDGSYTLPSGNLVDIEPSAEPEIYSYGLRNPYRYSFDACTGDLYIGDVGQDAWEELNVTALGAGQLNYGWDTMEGLHCYPSTVTNCDQTGITLPLYEHERGASAAITGGSVYRGSAIPALRGKYFFADSQQQRLWYTEYDSASGMLTGTTEVTAEVGGGYYVSVQNGYDGELYITNFTGSLLKLVELVAP